MRITEIILIFNLITAISANVRQTTYEQYRFSDITPFLDFELGSNPDPNANDRSCAMFCTMHKNCHFFKAVPGRHCLVLSYGSMVGASVSHGFEPTDMLYGKTNSGLVDVRYLTLSTDVPWTVARQFCEGEGAHLAEIHNEAQFDLVLNIGRANLGGVSMWLGGTDWGQWRWNTSGDPFTFTHWKPGEPNRSTERCLEMRLYENGLWIDRDCGITAKAICLF